MKKKIHIAWIIIFMVFVSLSCGLLIDDSKGTGTINVIMNNTYYDLTDVTGTEYLGFYCGGNILGKRMELALGANPQAGDTILFAGKNDTMYGEYSLYHHNYGIPNSGNIVVTEQSGSVVTGTFSFDVLGADNDTIHFRNGNFTVNFKPSR